MMFFGMFMLVVLPLCLVVAAQSMRRSEIAKRPVGKVLEIILYLSAALSIAGSLLVLFELV